MYGEYLRISYRLIEDTSDAKNEKKRSEFWMLWGVFLKKDGQESRISKKRG